MAVTVAQRGFLLTQVRLTKKRTAHVFTLAAGGVSPEDAIRFLKSHGVSAVLQDSRLFCTTQTQAKVA